MNEWQQQKGTEEIVSSLFTAMLESNRRYAIDELTKEQWAEEMRAIDGKLGIFGLRIDRPDRFSRTGR